MVLASEAGVLDIPPEQVREKGALRPGQMILVDLAAGRVLKDGEIKMRLARRQPYRRWVEENKIEIHGFFEAVSSGDARSGRRLLRRQKLLRLHARGHQPHPRPHGLHRPRAGGLHGRRRAAGRALREAPAALLVLQTALRPGDQPADRLDPRGTGHVADDLPGHPREHPDREAPARPAGQAEPPDPLQRGPGPHPRPEPARLQVPHAADRLSRRRHGRGPGRAPWTTSADEAEAAVEQDARILVLSDRDLPEGTMRHPRAAGGVGGQPAPRATGASAPGRA